MPMVLMNRDIRFGYVDVGVVVCCWLLLIHCDSIVVFFVCLRVVLCPLGRLDSRDPADAP